jgi:hypothetical protein
MGEFVLNSSTNSDKPIVAILHALDHERSGRTLARQKRRAPAHGFVAEHSELRNFETPLPLQFTMLPWFKPRNCVRPPEKPHLIDGEVVASYK